MGLFDHKDEEIRRLLGIIEKLEWTIDRQQSQIDRLIALIPKPTKPHPVKFDVVFN